MSDIGKYAALEAEVTAYIKGTSAITGVLSVNPTLSLDDLVARDGIRKPALGIIVLPTQYQKPRAVGYREMWVTAKVVVAVAITNMRGAVSARPQLYTIFESLHDRLHYQPSALSPTGRYVFQSEVAETHAEKDLLLGQAVYQIDLLMGQ